MNILRKLFIALSIPFSLVINAQEYCMTSPVGFGAQTTGGERGDIITVGTRDELKQALKKNEPAIIIVTQDITFGENQNVSVDPKDKTILGLKGVKLISTARVKNGGILGFGKGSSNIIIRNLIFEGPGAFDVDGRDLLTNTGCVNLWVDHCEFYDGVDDNFDNTKESDNISISWCKFGYRIPAKTEGMTGDGSGEHRFSNLIGGSSSDKPADGHYSVTFQYCYWADSCAQRMPRARNAELHLLNCYYNTGVKNSLAIGLGAGENGTTCYVEGCDFKKVGQVVRTDYDPVSGKEVAVKFVDCLKGGTNLGSVSQPSYEYPVLDVNQLESVITGSCGAGATLDVTLAGEVSSPCSNPSYTLSGETNGYPHPIWTINKGILEVTGTKVAEATLYNLHGQKVLQTNANNYLEIGFLENGIYIIEVKTQDGVKLTDKIVIR